MLKIPECISVQLAMENLLRISVYIASCHQVRDTCRTDVHQSPISRTKRSIELLTEWIFLLNQSSFVEATDIGILAKYGIRLHRLRKTCSSRWLFRR